MNIYNCDSIHEYLVTHKNVSVYVDMNIIFEHFKESALA